MKEIKYEILLNVIFVGGSVLAASIPNLLFWLERVLK